MIAMDDISFAANANGIEGASFISGGNISGTSNMTIPKLKLVLRDAEVLPAVNEMELHPHFQQPDLFDYCQEKGIVPIGYSPIGSPARRRATVSLSLASAASSGSSSGASRHSREACTAR